MIRRTLDNIRFIGLRPVIAGRALAGAIAARAGHSRLRSIDLDVTYRCPLSCSQCYAADYTRAGPVLTGGELTGLFEQAQRLGAIHVNISGGEALLRDDLEDIVARARNSGLLVSLCTSGMGLRQRRLRRLKEAGLDVLLLSLDSHEASIHDSNRGIPGLFQTVLDAARFARSMGLRVGFNTVATSAKIGDGTIQRLAEIARAVDAHLNLTVPVAIGRWHDNDRILLSEHDRRRFLDLLGRNRIRTDTMSNFGPIGCPAGSEKLSITPDGSVRACQVLSPTYGNVRREPLRDIWMRARRLTRDLRHQRFCPAGQANARSGDIV